MSGGHFEYSQWHIDEIFRQILEVITHNMVEVPKESLDPRWDFNDDGTVKEWAKYYYRLKPETIEKFKDGYRKLKEAYVYAQRIDWLLSGDDGEETFHERLKEELNKVDEEVKNETWKLDSNDDETGEF